MIHYIDIDSLTNHSFYRHFQSYLFICFNSYFIYQLFFRASFYCFVLFYFVFIFSIQFLHFHSVFFSLLLFFRIISAATHTVSGAFVVHLITIVS